jgi:hypothetical protein
MAKKKILYFTASNIPTVNEAAEIAALELLVSQGFELGVRNKVQNTFYSDDNLEVCDYVAGIAGAPAIYSAKDIYQPGAPVLLQLLPTTAGLLDNATLQLQALKVTGHDLTALTIVDVTAVTTTYTSSVTGKATVSAGGLVSGVAAGTTVITATHTYTSGKTVTATLTVTVTAH